MYKTFIKLFQLKRYTGYEKIIMPSTMKKKTIKIKLQASIHVIELCGVHIKHLTVA